MNNLKMYDFPFKVNILGKDDHIDKLMVSMFIQNGYIINHLILTQGCEQDIHSEVNEIYVRKKFSSVGILTEYLTTLKDMLIINIEDIMNIKKTNIPMIVNKNFKVYIPRLDKELNVFTEQEIVSLSGILSSMRGYQDTSAPFVPSLHLFEIVGKVIFVGILANLLQFYKLDSNKDLQIDNIPFLNIVYFHFNFFKIFIHSFKEKFDKGEHMFPGNCYNYYKTKDNKFVSFGNLEKKFQKNFFNVIKIMDKEKRDNKNYNYRAIQDVLSNYTRKEIQDKFKNLETCFSPVLSIREAKDFSKNLNKNIILPKNLNPKRLRLIEEVEAFLFPKEEENVIVDLSSYINLHSKF